MATDRSSGAFRKETECVLLQGLELCSVGTTFQVYACSATYFISARTKEFETQDGLHFFGGLKGQFLF